LVGRISGIAVNFPIGGFYQNEKQIKSAGSLLLGMGFYYFHIVSDSSWLSKTKNIPVTSGDINADLL
jgi:hypothetical protein